MGREREAGFSFTLTLLLPPFHRGCKLNNFEWSARSNHQPKHRAMTLVACFYVRT